ncbi:MAG: DUF6797 domain-containing protein [Imperialibacter sp.]|uniref:DUF6797 domain-containing protein n=1 Tax=Imperialibacter sp. TaxID=2038411 RepID=UPI0032EACC79
MKQIRSHLMLLVIAAMCFVSCSTHPLTGTWDFTISFGDEELTGTLQLNQAGDTYKGVMRSFDLGTMDIGNLQVDGQRITGNILMWQEDQATVTGEFEGDRFSGVVTLDQKEYPITATRQSEPTRAYEPAKVDYVLSESDVADAESDIDHAGLIEDFSREGYVRGGRVYNANCINCHGNKDVEGSIPMSLQFWAQPFKAGFDPFSMYQTITRGYGAMPAQLILTPQEKYDVISYIREEFVKNDNTDQYFKVTPGYLAGLPKGTSRGSAAMPYHPWSDMDYGNFFINTYELADEKTSVPRYHSPGPSPFPDEDYSKNNFAYKGIAIRLDEGAGGVSKGNSWMIFDHDVMRVAGGWTGEGFIDWNGILLNDRHETYPRTIGKLHFETPVGPGWANPATGSFEDPRFTARDGRQFGPLPKKWANYKGLYYFEDKVVISYSVGNAIILEKPGVEKHDEQTIFTRTLNISPSKQALKLRVAVAGTAVAMSGNGASLAEEDGYVILNVTPGTLSKIKLFIAGTGSKALGYYVASASPPELLDQYTHGGPAHYSQVIRTTVTKGREEGQFAVDNMTPPFDNLWKSRMKFSGIDFMRDPDVAVLCTTDGDVWKVTGLLDEKGALVWKRIASGLFQPLGIKVLEEKIYVTCRDQLVLLRDLNGDEETDFYESFNHDHQVTDHFHEFAMGLQADNEGNLYYAKSGRHARESLIPQHGTLLKVSKDGSKTEIIATGFRAANGVCINPDGSFIVTDQQGYWNPMNRVNWIEGKGKFYGNMWGYNPPKDSSRAGMEPPMVWIDMEFDRSPSELLWVDSKKWGSLDGSLLSFSYGYGKIQLVLTEKVDGQRQAGVIDLPGVKFLSGVMRGRFNPEDGQLYACGMSAWGTSQMMRGGEFYRVRYTGSPLSVPVALAAEDDGVRLSFANELDRNKAMQPTNYEVQTWDIVRSRKYGSKRYNMQTLPIQGVQLSRDGKTVKLFLEGIKPVDIMTIAYAVTDVQGNELKGKLQNTIHHLKPVQKAKADGLLLE